MSEKKPEKKFVDPVPIPSNPRGGGNGVRYVVDEKTWTIKVDFFFDFGCPWSAYFWEKVWLKIHEYYFKDKSNKSTEEEAGYGDIVWNYNFFPTPYIPIGFNMAKTATYMLQTKPEVMWDFFTNYFAKYKEVSPDVTEKMTDLEIVRKIYDVYMKPFGIDEDHFYKAMTTFHNSLFMKAAQGYKYAASKGCSMSPTMFVNDVVIEGRWEFEDWKALFDKIKKTQKFKLINEWVHQ